MKAFVVKNKNNKVLCWDDTYGRDYFDHFNLASMKRIQFFNDYRGEEVEINVNEICDKTCEVVEILITTTKTNMEIINNESVCN